VTLGPSDLLAVAAVQALSVAPLAFAPNVPILAARRGLSAARQGMALFAVDGWLGGTTYFIWQVALFVSLAAAWRRSAARWRWRRWWRGDRPRPWPSHRPRPWPPRVVVAYLSPRA